MNLYIYNFQAQQIGILEDTEDKALSRYRLWAQRYGKDLSEDPIIWTKAINTVGAGLVIESLSAPGGQSRLDAHWGACESHEERP